MVNWGILTSILATILIIAFLYHQKWKIKHIISLVLGLGFALIFSVYGQNIITPLWKGVNASDLWIIMFFVIYVGGAIAAIIPFYVHEPHESHKVRFMHFLKLFLIAGITYTALDNALYGPFAVGPNSPYIGQDLCHLSPTNVAEDVFFGCQIQRLGLDPFSSLAANIVYFWTTLVIGMIALLWVGAKKFEQIVFELPQ